METATFKEWFFKFCTQVTDWPLLLLYDGHLTHVSIDVVEKAMAERIIIIKFPPHVTDVLQPLDVSCFGPLKREWDRLLHQRISTIGLKEPLRKPEFVNQISRIWHLGMKRENAISGFETTGMYLLNWLKINDFVNYFQGWFLIRS